MIGVCDLGPDIRAMLSKDIQGLFRWEIDSCILKDIEGFRFRNSGSVFIIGKEDVVRKPGSMGKPVLHS